MTAQIKPVIGTQEDDVLNGGNGHEVFSGLDGDDVIRAGNGHDLAYGGAGNDDIYGQSGDDILYGSLGPSFVEMSSFVMAEDYNVKVIFENESAGYRNSLGSYTLDENGNIVDVQFHFPNASLQGSGGDLQSGDASEMFVEGGTQIGFFVLANGFSYNGGYDNFDLSSGSLEFRNSDGSAATLESHNPQLWYVSDAGEESKLKYHSYHSAAGVDEGDYSLNPDGIAHTVALLNTNEGEITLGFEDLYNGGDRDFDDSVFTVEIGLIHLSSV